MILYWLYACCKPQGKLEDLSVESGRMEDAIYESGTLITQMEQLCDFSHVIDLLHVLLLMWAEVRECGRRYYVAAGGVSI